MPSRLKQRKRQRQAWQQTTEKSSTYALKLHEDFTGCPYTQLEYILISQIIKYLQRKGIDSDIDTIHAVYTVCTDLTNAMKLSLPLCSKNENKIC